MSEKEFIDVRALSLFCAFGENRDFVVENLSEASVDFHPLLTFVGRVDSEGALPQLAQERRTVEQDSDLTVVSRDHHGGCVCFKDHFLRRQNGAVDLALLCHTTDM